MIGIGGQMPEGTDGQQIFASIRRLVQYVRISGRALERESGLTAAQFVALEELARAPGLSLAQLAERCCTDESSTCVVISRLVGRGLVNRQRDSHDARRLVLTPTAEGRALVKAMEKEGSPDHITDILDRVGESERASFADTLERIVNELTARQKIPSAHTARKRSVGRLRRKFHAASKGRVKSEG